MSRELRALVEQHLVADLAHYGICQPGLLFDWSESCIEGHDGKYLGSSLENYSGVAVFDANDNPVAEGWLEFVLEGWFFLAYWEFLTTCDAAGQELAHKTTPGIPDHVWQQLPPHLHGTYRRARMRTSPFTPLN